MTNVAEKVREFKEGLADVVAGESAICFIDGAKGVLSYRGIDIHDLADNSTFEEVCFLLLEGRLPARKELEATVDELGRERAVPAAILKLLATSLAAGAIPMDALRTAVSALASTDADMASNSPEANRRKAIRLTAQVATLVAAIHRAEQGLDVLPPDPKLRHAEDFLRMLNGEPPSIRMSKALDMALILHADHEWNASTFAARVTAATLADMHAAVTSAIGTLKGPLHGGANEAVMKMLLAIGSLDRVDEFIHDLLNRKQKIMGFGHRVYTTEDPRATHLRRMSKELAEEHSGAPWYEMSRRIETIINTEKHLNCNVDFYSASVYYMLGIPPEMFTPIFALSRMSGWTAHIQEQHHNNRLIRPRAEYIGPAYPQRYVPIAER